jgi:hypothetical protein
LGFRDFVTTVLPLESIAVVLHLSRRIPVPSQPLTALFALSIISITAFVCVRADEPAEESLPVPLHGEMVVHLKGVLQVSTTLKAGADPNSRPQDDGAWELTNASVDAGGSVVNLDWNSCPAIRDALLWWRNLRHGDLRVGQAEVTGRMTFRRSGDIGGISGDFGGIRVTPFDVSEQTLVPVVVVESLKVQLVGPEGWPRGPQFDRELVKSTKGRSAKAVNRSNQSRGN